MTPVLTRLSSGGGFGFSKITVASSAASAYAVSRSLRFNSADSAYLSRTPASAGNRKTWTWSGWVKRSGLSSTQRIFSSSNSSNTEGFYCELVSGDTLTLYDYSSPTIFWQKTTSQVFRDASAWFHLQVTFDSTNATPGDRVKLYVNGVLVTAFSTSSNPSPNYDSYWNAARVHAIGRTGDSNAGYFSGLLADIYFIDGSAKVPEDFAETDATTGAWNPKAYSGPALTGNSFHLDFADNSAATAAALGKDTSGLGNNWDPYNLSVTAGAGNDSLRDSPTNGTQTDTGVGGEVVGNYCTWNPLNGDSSATLSNGNLDITSSGASRHRYGTFGLSSGKWYWEYVFTGASIDAAVGVSNNTSETGSTFTGMRGYVSSTGNKYSGTTASAYGSSWGASDVIGVALDMDNSKIWFSKNGTWQASGNPANGTNAAFTDLTGTWFPLYRESGSSTGSTNFGARPFAYTAPSGFKALNTANLPTPTIAKGSDYFDVKLYTGNGSTQTISGLNFSPDFVWIKDRTQAGIWHNLFDEVRGVGKRLASNDTAAEVTNQIYGYLSAFTSNGFTVTAGSSGADNTNYNNDAYVAWAWDAGSSTVTNTQGSITSTVRANASAGFSVVKFTYSSSGTVGHGLGVAPAFIIKKNIDSVAAGYDNWHSYHSSLGDLKYLLLNSTVKSGSAAFGWGSNSTTFNANASYFDSGTFVAYCFAPVAGYSAMGSYVGNGSSTDGPFVYTGFRPAFTIVKRTDTAASWMIYDSKRNPVNVIDDVLFANLANAEEVSDQIDYLSNGIKMRTTGTSFNANGGSYIYIAFAESPFALARAR